MFGALPTIIGSHLATRAGSKLGQSAAKDYRKRKDTLTPQEYNLESYGTDFSSLLDKDLAGMRSAYNSVGSGGGAIDLSPMINNYKASAQNQKDTFTNQYNMNRNDLLTSIKRFQEQTAESKQLQRSNYLNQREDLEEAGFMADRANRISAAQQGIGGSGLQQLSQLGILLNQGRDISKAAQANQRVQDDLSKRLNQAQEDSDKKLKNLSDVYQTNLNKVDIETTNLINNLIRNEKIRQQEAAARAASQRASIRAQMASEANALKQSYATGVQVLNSVQNDLNNKLKELANGKGSRSTKQKKAKELVSEATTLLNNSSDGVGLGYLAQYGLGNDYYNTAVSNYDNLLKKYGLK